MNRVSAPAFLNEPIEYDAPVPFSRGVLVDLRGRNLLVISGTASVGPNGESLYRGDFKAQASRMLENATALLAAASASWADVFKTTYYLADMAHYEELSAIRVAFLATNRVKVFPASTCVQATLCRPELLCEMELMAAVTNGVSTAVSR